MPNQAHSWIQPSGWNGYDLFTLDFHCHARNISNIFPPIKQFQNADKTSVRNTLFLPKHVTVSTRQQCVKCWKRTFTIGLPRLHFFIFLIFINVSIYLIFTAVFISRASITTFILINIVLIFSTVFTNSISAIAYIYSDTFLIGITVVTSSSPLNSFT